MACIEGRKEKCALCNKTKDILHGIWERCSNRLISELISDFLRIEFHDLMSKKICCGCLKVLEDVNSLRYESKINVSENNYNLSSEELTQLMSNNSIRKRTWEQSQKIIVTPMNIEIPSDSSLKSNCCGNSSPYTQMPTPIRNWTSLLEESSQESSENKINNNNMSLLPFLSDSSCKKITKNNDIKLSKEDYPEEDIISDEIVYFIHFDN